MISPDLLEARRELLAGDQALQSLSRRIRGRVERILRELPPVPRVKALLSRNGGVCPDDGTALAFDPWSPDSHRCPGCGKSWPGERHHRHWARAQQLWLAERAADLATLAVLEGDEAAAVRAGELIRAQAGVYRELPNKDNVLGPTHLFFSTYLESMWILSWLSAAFLLREAGLLPEETAAAVDPVAEEAAALIGEFNEGLSNRQVWNAAALTAIAAWFGDEELAETAVESRTGLLGLLADGFEGRQGVWWEGENYHLFALRGLMLGIRWARVSGMDLLEDPELRSHFEAALVAPTLTALPDLTFPARKDSRFGVSLAQPAYLELWEIGRTWLGPVKSLDGWLAALYQVAAPEPEHYDAWLHDSGLPSPKQRSAADLSWWSLLELEPREAADEAWIGESCLVEPQGLAVLRNEHRYVSLECGAVGGGHGHPDRLHLTLHAHGVHWLADPGAASYVDRSLFWYRSPLAHNSPSLDGESPERADCEFFDIRGKWGWARGRAGEVTRTVVAGPELILDLVELDAREARTLILPWHLQGETTVVTEGRWVPDRLENEFVAGAEKFEPTTPGPVSIESTSGAARIRLVLSPGAELLRASGPGLPRRPPRATFYLQRVQAVSTTRLVSLIELAPAAPAQVVVKPEGFAVMPAGVQVTRTNAGIAVTSPDGRIELSGPRPPRAAPKPLLEERPSWDAMASAPPPIEAPAVDGSLDGFDLDSPITLDADHQYRRSEEPYDPERFAADAWLNWDSEGLYLGVHVRKPEVVAEPDSASRDLDNEVDDLHQDGIQLYLRWPDGSVSGWVITPSGDSIRARPVMSGEEGEVAGGWGRTEDGYLLSLRVRHPELVSASPGARLGFDLLINEMTADRERRLGQLVWSGGGGWVYLRGDGHDPARFGTVELK